MGLSPKGGSLRWLQAHNEKSNLFEEISYWAPLQARQTELDFLLRRGKEYLALGSEGTVPLFLRTSFRSWVQSVILATSRAAFLVRFYFTTSPDHQCVLRSDRRPHRFILSCSGRRRSWRGALATCPDALLPQPFFQPSREGALPEFIAICFECPCETRADL